MKLGRVLLSLLFVLALACVAEAATATLTWSDMSTNELGFTVQRKAEPCAGTVATFGEIATVGANVATYVDSTVVSGNTYCYRVNAWNTVDGTANGTKQFSAWSNTAGILIPFGVPVVPGQLGVVAAP